MTKKKVTGYIYHNGMWYKQYGSGKREIATDKEIQEHIDRVMSEKEAEMKRKIDNEYSEEADNDNWRFNI